MESHVELLEGERVRLTVEVPAHEVAHALAHALDDLADRVKVPGFRAGHVPPEVLVSRLGRERVFSEAVESHISGWFWSAARESRLRPVEAPDFNYELPESEEEGWSFAAEFGVQGPVEPADWRELEVPKFEVELKDEFADEGLAILQDSVASLSAVEGRSPRPGDVAVVDILGSDGHGQRDYVVELGSERLLEEIEAGLRELEPGQSSEVSWQVGPSEKRNASVTLKELYEKVLPPLDDELARSASEFDTLEELRADITEQMRLRLEEAVESRFRSDAVDELVKASKVELAELLVEMRTRDLLAAFVRQIEARGVSVSTYLQMTGIGPRELERSLQLEAMRSLARELVLEGAAAKLGIEVTDEDLRTQLRESGESEEDVDELLSSELRERVREDLRLKRAVDRIAAEVKPISRELAEAREKLWTPEKEAAAAPAKKLWTPGGSDEGVVA